MYEVYKQMLGLQAYQVLTKFPTIPEKKLAIGESEVLHSVPLQIYSKAQLPRPQAVVDYSISQPYEKTALKGSGDTLTLKNFVTDDFQLGQPYMYD